MFNFNKYNAGKDTNLDDFIENFKVFIVCNEGLIKLKNNNVFNLYQRDPLQ